MNGKSITYSYIVCLLISAMTAGAETFIQDFKSRKDFDTFWNISTWGNEKQQYAAANVTLDTANGWVRLKIDASPRGIKPVCGEISSKRFDFLYGSYRASIKFDTTPGAVVGWFVYKDVPDLHEIDVEYLTEEISHVHYTLHHIQTGVDYCKYTINFDPTAAFHEYRFDWYSNRVVYFIDGIKTDSLVVNVPDAACTIMLNYWSANIDGWGGAAPEKDTYMYIDYVHYYSDNGATSMVSKGYYWKKPEELRMAQRPNRLFRCNGQMISISRGSEDFSVVVPGLFICTEQRAGETAKRCVPHLSFPNKRY